MAKAKPTDPVTGNWTSPEGLWHDPNDLDGDRIGDKIVFTITSGKSRYKSYIGVCVRDNISGSRQDYKFYGDKNKNGIVDKKDKLLGEFWIYTYQFIRSPITSGSFAKQTGYSPLFMQLGSPDALQYSDSPGASPPGPVGYGGTLGSSYF